MGASIAPPPGAQNAEKTGNFFKIFAAEKACWAFFTIALPPSRTCAHIQVESRLHPHTPRLTVTDQALALPAASLRPGERAGFLLSRHWRDTPAGVEIELWVATDDGPQCLRLPPQTAVAFVPQAQAERVQALIANEPGMELRALEHL